MVVIHDEPSAIECAYVLDRMLAERTSGTKGNTEMHSVGGWHTPYFKIGEGWLGEAMKRRLERAGETRIGTGKCWGNILSAGARYTIHTHGEVKRVAVWCLSDSGGSLLVADEAGDVTIVDDRIGRLTIFSGTHQHWVPIVERDRFTVAVNLPKAAA